MDDLVLTEDQLKCLASPTCNEIVSNLRAMGEGSSGDLAKRVGKSAATVHYHLQSLVRSGLVREVARRPTARKPEAVYAITAARLRLPEPDASPESAALVRKAVLAGQRQVMRGYEEAAKAGDRTIDVVRAHLRLSPEDAKQFFAMITAAAQFARGRQSPEGKSFHWSSVVYEEPPR